jgi:cellulose synthase/poly-beta-1,6-N-acetylglucosamine synthase-like glycosyltransferase/peptidoglycan/xylan/chitin deacetylase (PgdA/CDA1 family)
VNGSSGDHAGSNTAERIRHRIRWPPGHWLLFGMVLVGVLAALLTRGYASADLGGSSTAPAESVPVRGLDLSSAGPIMDFSGPTIRSLGAPPRTVALTFDDGPDPTWTPRILAVLRRLHVPATFFVVGARVAEHPGLLRREVAEGEEIGVHTFTHVDLGSVPGWRETLELSLTQAVLGGAAGIHSALLRLPYSSTPLSLTEPELRAARAAAERGYLLVFSDRDSEDWRRPGVGRIVLNSTPIEGRGAIVLMHDGGGDRSQTVQALEPLIESLRARGYRFTTVSELAGMSASSVIAPVHGGSRLQGLAVLWALRVSFVIGGLISLLPIPVLVLTALRSIFLVLLAHRHVRRRRHFEHGPVTLPPPVSIVVPAYNEEVGIEKAIRSLAASDYPDFEIVVVDDGSTDRTAEIVEELDVSSLSLVRQANMGKPHALNTGVGRARHGVIVTVDADTVFQPETLSRLVRPFREPTVGAVSGNTKVGNRRGLIGRWQHIEYVMGFNLDRRAFDVLEAIPTVPGAVGGFRREALRSIGGFSDDTLAEDTDATMALNQAGWHVVYEEAAVAWTEAPTTWAALWQQRYRWSYGTMQSMWKHRSALRSGDGHLRRSLPYLVFFTVFMPMVSPVIDLFTVYGLLFLNPWLVLGYWVGLNLIQLALAAYAFRLDRESLRPLWALPLQQVLYRQLVYLVLIQSVVSALRGVLLRWHKLRRTGDVQMPAAVP